MVGIFISSVKACSGKINLLCAIHSIISGKNNLSYLATQYKAFWLLSNNPIDNDDISQHKASI